MENYDMIQYYMSLEIKKVSKKAKKKFLSSVGFEPRTAKVLKSQHFSAFDHTNTYKEMAFLALFTLVPAEEVTIRADFFASSSQTYYTHFKPKTASKKLNPEEEMR